MRVRIPFYDRLLDVNFPEDAVILQPRTPTLNPFVERKLIDSFKSCGSSFANKKTAIVVNDATRRLPIPWVLEILLKLIELDDVRIFVATGTHRLPTESELEKLFGKLWPIVKDRVVVHDCYDHNTHVMLGYTSRGTPVEINRKLLEAECLICVNSVEPHFFAGFTGGRKSLVPGLSSFRTIVTNHSHAKSERARSLNVNNNPLHLDLEEAISMIPERPLFSVQMVLSRSGDIVDLFCGDIEKSFQAACRMARELHAIPRTQKYDIVVAIAEAPLDINLYQLQKAQEHGAVAVADEGILIVVGACQEGVGSPYFVQLADEYPTPDMALSGRALSDNRFGIHKLIKTARSLKKMKIWYVTKLDDKIIRKVYLEPKQSVQAAVDESLRIKGGNAQVAILPGACFLVPTPG